MPICPECQKEGDEVGAPCPDDEYHYVANRRLREVGNDPLLGYGITDKYVIIDRLAEGGMGAIYRALQLPMRREVAVKVLKAEVDRSNTGRKRFAREARAISKLSHPNIITLHDFGFDDSDRPFMVMEYASGVPVSHWLVEDDPSTVEMIHVARQVLSALAEAHDREVIHRDLKPANVMVTRAGGDDHFAKLLDFGLARMINRETQAGLTRDGEVFGTPHYMSPEQARSSGEVGPPSDVYAVAILLFRFFCGRVPFHEERPLQVLFKHLNEPLPELEPAEGLVLPDPVATVIRTAASKQPGDRYRDGRAMLEAFDEAVQEAGDQGLLRRRQKSPTPGRIDPVSMADAAEMDQKKKRQATTVQMDSPVSTTPTLAALSPEEDRDSSSEQAQSGDTVDEFPNRADSSASGTADNPPDPQGETEKAWQSARSAEPDPAPETGDSAAHDSTAPSAPDTERKTATDDDRQREPEEPAGGLEAARPPVETEETARSVEKRGEKPRLGVLIGIMVAGLVAVAAGAGVLVVLLDSDESAPATAQTEPEPRATGEASVDAEAIAETSRRAAMLADRTRQAAQRGVRDRPEDEGDAPADTAGSNEAPTKKETSRSADRPTDEVSPEPTDAADDDPEPTDEEARPQPPAEADDQPDEDVDPQPFERPGDETDTGEEADTTDESDDQPRPFERPSSDDS